MSRRALLLAFGVTTGGWAQFLRILGRSEAKKQFQKSLVPNCMCDLPTSDDLHAERELRGFDFLRTGFELCNTFADLANARRETGNRSGVEQASANAENGYVTTIHSVEHLRDEQQKVQMNQRRQKLRSGLDNVER